MNSKDYRIISNFYSASVDELCSPNEKKVQEGAGEAELNTVFFVPTEEYLHNPELKHVIMNKKAHFEKTIMDISYLGIDDIYCTFKWSMLRFCTY